MSVDVRRPCVGSCRTGHCPCMGSVTQTVPATDRPLVPSWLTCGTVCTDRISKKKYSQTARSVLTDNAVARVHFALPSFRSRCGGEKNCERLRLFPVGRRCARSQEVRARGKVIVLLRSCYSFALQIGRLTDTVHGRMREVKILRTAFL